MRKTAILIAFLSSNAFADDLAPLSIFGGQTTDEEVEAISASFTSGGMTITATMDQIDNIDGTTTTTEDRERWALGASFAF